MQHRPKFCFVIKCTMPIGRTSWPEIGRLCKSDSSPCSPPLGTYEKVQKTKKNSFALIYKIPKLQVNICNTNKVVAIFQFAEKPLFLGRFWFFPSTGEGGPPRHQVIQPELSLQVSRKSWKVHFGNFKFDRICTLAPTQSTSLKVEYRIGNVVKSIVFVKPAWHC